MYYFISFLEGIITFISPCILPMLPIYVSYFTGETDNKKSTISNAVGFVIGFTILFTLLGTFAGTIGSFFIKHQTLVNIICGAVIIFLGAGFLGLYNIKFFKPLNKSIKKLNLLSSITFGMVFAISWTPCVGTFLGSALMLASFNGSSLKGFLMLLCYSIGLGIPFILSAVLINQLKGTFNFIKNNYKAINTLSGCFLILIGILMMTGMLGKIIYTLQ